MLCTRARGDDCLDMRDSLFLGPPLFLDSACPMYTRQDSVGWDGAGNRLL